VTTHKFRTAYRSRGLMAEFEKRLLEGDTGALRPIVRQAIGPNTLDLPFKDVQLRAKPDGTGGERLLFTGYASVVEAPFTMWDWYGDYVEIVRAGAFTKTLSEDPDVIFCLNHDWLAAPMARTKAGTLRLSEDATGLWTEADIDGTRDDVHRVQSCMDAGELDAMSFAFFVTKQSWSPDYDQRDILEVGMDGGDTSVVTFPANPATTGTTDLRARAGTALVRSGVPAVLLEHLRAEQRAGKALSSSTMETLQEVLDLIAASDVGLDSAQEILSGLMGVPNPDDEDQNDVGADGSAADDDSKQESQSITGGNGHDPALVRERLRLQAVASK